jgi:WD40 repeat protein
MDDIPRQTLKQILQQHGTDVCDNPRRCEGLLRDYCGEYRREIFVLISALENGVADDLRAMAPQLPFSVVLPRITAELRDTTALSEDAARWAVVAWADALGLADGTELSAVGQTSTTNTGSKTASEVSGYRLIHQWQAHGQAATDIAFSPDGHQLATVGLDSTARIWDVATAQESLALKQQTGILTSVAWHPGGLLLALGSGDTGIYLWRWSDLGVEGLRRLRGHTGNVSDVSFLTDGKGLVSSAHDGTIKLWDIGSGQIEASLHGHTAAVLAVAVSTDSRTLGSAGGWDRTVRIWDLKQRQQLWTLTGHTAQVTSVAFGGRDRTLVSGSWDETVRIWDPKLGKPQGVLSEQGKALRLITSVSLSADSTYVAAGDWDGNVHLWHKPRKQHQGTLSAHTARIRAVSFSPGRLWLASADDQGTVCLWRTERV